VKELDEIKPVIFCGDMNVAHTEIDLAHPKANEGEHGFTQEEREGMSNFLDAGFIDSYRHFFPDKLQAYTWWTQWGGARLRNVGWRIDYFLVSKKLAKKLKKAEILPDIMGSDHCPVAIEVDL
jgi:exodeoxyribonuclease III